MNNPCNDGLYCDGVETCAVDNEVEAGYVCTDGVAVECDAGFYCDEETDACAELTNQCQILDCDDDDFCTDDTCDETLEACVNTAVDCGDNVCNPADGECVECIDAAGCDDADACTTDTCVDNVCGYEDVVCGEGETCVSTVGCVVVCTEDGDCEDSDACTDDACVDGACANTAVDCDDADACTTDTCDAATGCVNTDVVCDPGFECDPATGGCVEAACTEDADCNDDDFCTDDMCTDGVCENVDVVCDDADDCTVDSCDPVDGNCVFDPLCDDDDLCTTDTCDAGVCDFEEVTCPQGESCNPASGDCEDIECTSAADCDDGFSCTVDSCNTTTGVCIYTPEDALCEDNLFCTGGVPVADVCNPDDADAGADGCVRDGSPCANPTPVCNEATNACEACEVHSDCNDGFSCTVDTCDDVTGNCTNAPVNANCADPDFCDGSDECIPADPNADAAGCVPPGDPCAGLPCDEVANVCFPCEDETDCDDNVPCTDDTCTVATGVCTNTPNDVNCPDLLYCDGVDACIPGDDNADGNGCVGAGNPCANPNPVCEEDTDSCTICVLSADCPDLDGIDCTEPRCDSITGVCGEVDICTGGLSCLGGVDGTICD